MMKLLPAPVRQDKLTGELFALSELMLQNMRQSAEIGSETHGGPAWKAFGRARSTRNTTPGRARRWRAPERSIRRAGASVRSIAGSAGAALATGLRRLTPRALARTALPPSHARAPRARWLVDRISAARGRCCGLKPWSCRRRLPTGSRAGRPPGPASCARARARVAALADRPDHVVGGWGRGARRDLDHLVPGVVECGAGEVVHGHIDDREVLRFARQGYSMRVSSGPALPTRERPGSKQSSSSRSAKTSSRGRGIPLTGGGVSSR